MSASATHRARLRGRRLVGVLFGGVLVLTSCGRFGIDPLAGDGGALDPDTLGDGGEQGPGDALPDAACAGQFSAPMRLPGSFNTAEKDWGPVVSADDSTMYFYSLRDGGSGPPDLWVSVRPVGGEFAAPEILAASSSAVDMFPRVTADELELFQSSARMGGLGMADLWQSTRASTSEAFGAAVALIALNSTSIDEAMTVTGDGLDAVFTSNRGGSFDLYRTSRPDRASPFASPELVPELATGDDERAPFLSPDGLTLYFSSDRAGGLGNLDVWSAVRPSRMQPFGPATHLTILNSSRDDYAPSISADGLTLYYSYDAPIVGGAGDPDVWVATRLCSP